jgi:16S rRNA processing protein RimM
LRLYPFNPDTTALTAGAQVCVERAGSRSSEVIEFSRAHKNQFLIKLAGIDNIDDARAWVGSTLFVEAQALQSLEAGEYYHYQVIGFDVLRVDGAKVGTITSIMSTPGTELYVVQGAKKEHLIPAVKEFIEEVDFTAHRIIINPPDGLLDL